MKTKGLVLVTVILLLFAGTSSVLHAATIDYIPADMLKGVDYPGDDAQFPLIQGQKGDLIFTFGNVVWSTVHSCCDKTVATGVSFDIMYRWKIVPPGLIGAGTVQAETVDARNGPDTLWVGWQSPEDFLLDPANTTGGFLDPIGPGAFGQVRWDGVAETSQNPQTYHVALKIRPRPPFSCCEDVPVLDFSATFLHTYIGDTHFTTGESVSVFVGYPFSIGIGTTARLEDRHAWSKSLVNERLIRPPGVKLNDFVLLGEAPPPGCCDECCRSVPYPSTLVLLVLGVGVCACYLHGDSRRTARRA